MNIWNRGGFLPTQLYVQHLAQILYLWRMMYMIQKAERCYLFLPAYMEFEFPEEEAAWAFPASLFLQNTDDQLWWGRCGLFSCFWLFDTSLCQCLGWHTGQFCACFLPPECGARRCFAPVIVPCGEFFLTVLAAGKLVAFSGSFFI